jgi:hypothetical protein
MRRPYTRYQLQQALNQPGKERIKDLIEKSPTVDAVVFDLALARGQVTGY